METPILFLVFNRPSLTQRVFDEIKKVKPKKLYVAIDGPRIGNTNDLSNINEVLKIFNDVTWQCEFKLLKREVNLGCGVSISNALNWFFKYEEEGIILEDDCIPSLSFFLFAMEMLDKYRYNKNVFAINGSNPISDHKFQNSYTFSSYNLIWGWATWKRAWSFYDFDLNKYSSFDLKLLLFRKFYFDLISIRSWYKHLNLVKNGTINTWDYQWIFVCLINNGFVITPEKNLVENVGNLVEPTHGVIKSSYIGLKSKNLDFPLKHPEKVQLDRIYDMKIKAIRFGNTFFLYLKAKLNKLKL